MSTMPLRRVFANASPLAYGCMRIGGNWDDTPLTDDDQERADRALDAALSVGITVFDHADIYCRGKSESAFGDWFRRRAPDRDSLWLQSKAGIHLGGPGEDYRYDLSPEHVRRQIELSLERLGVNYLDAWMLHRPDPLVDPPALADTLLQLREAGAVRHFGVSNMPPAQVQLWESLLGPLLLAQQEMSVAHLGWLDGTTDFNTGNAVATDAADLVALAQSGGALQLQAWGSLAQGRLRPTEDQNPTGGLLETVSALSARYETTPEALALAFLLRHPAGIQPVIGTTNPDRIGDCAQATTIELTREDWYRLYTAAREHPLP